MRVVNSTNNNAPLNFLRSIIQHKPRWILLFSGSHLLDELEPYWDDTLINAQSIRMSYLKEKEAENLIREPISNFPDIYSDGAVARLLYWTRCQPFLIQLFCTVLVDKFNQRDEPLKQTATEEDIDNLVPAVMERGQNYLRELWRKSITAKQQEMLIQLITEDHLEGFAQVQIRALINKEVIEKCGDGYGFQVPIVEKYCRQQVE